MTHQLDYYGILQVHPRAEREVIDAAYRKLAAKYHPDVNKLSGGVERMKQINAAYEVLSDPAKRAAYDASRGAASSPDTPPRAAPGHQSSKTRLIWLIVAVVIVLAVVLSRTGPALGQVAGRLVVPLAILALVVWLLLNLAKPRR